MLASTARRPAVAAALCTARRAQPRPRAPRPAPRPARVHPVPAPSLAPRRLSDRLRFTPAPSSSPSAPLVILFGWLGARDKDLSKYAALWNGMGYPTLAARPSVGASLLPWRVDAAADAVADAAAAALDGDDRRGVLAHVFSNAGFLLAGTLLARNSAASTPLHFRGALLDSCPARVTADMAVRGVVAAVAGEPADGVERRRRRTVALARPPLAALLRLNAQRLDAAWDAWSADDTVLPKTAPLTFAYAINDALIPTAEVTAFAAARAAAGGRVAGVHGFDSPHCEHLRVHPAAYEALVAEFAAEAAGVGVAEA